MQRSFQNCDQQQYYSVVNHDNHFCSYLLLLLAIVLVLIITCLGGQFGTNCLSVFLKILKLSELNKGKFKIFKIHKGDLSQKSPEQNVITG